MAVPNYIAIRISKDHLKIHTAVHTLQFFARFNIYSKSFTKKIPKPGFESTTIEAGITTLKSKSTSFDQKFTHRKSWLKSTQFSLSRFETIIHDICVKTTTYYYCGDIGLVLEGYVNNYYLFSQYKENICQGNCFGVL